MKNDLQQFVYDSLVAGKTREDISDVLSDAGWNEETIVHSLGLFSETPFPVPVPSPKTEFPAKEAFQYLVSFMALYFSAFSLAALWYSFIDIAFHDSSGYGALPTAISALIVAYPVYIFFTWKLFKEESQDISRTMSSVGRWLTYLTLATTAAIIIVDMIVLISTFLTEGLALRFVLKVLVVLLISGCIFLFYRWRLKKGEDRESTPKI